MIKHPLVFFPLVPLLVAALIGRYAGGRWANALTRALDSRWAPYVIGAIATVVVAIVFGGLDPTPWIHDEYAYRLQAQIFARGRWAMPSPPLPEFFEQFHVFVVPKLAPKYPPGHALLMVPGVWLGAPALVPVLLSGAAAALLYTLSRRLSNAWVALFACLFWLTTRAGLTVRASYLSETTTTVLWLAGWWTLLQWRETRLLRWLAALALCVAWGAITRPFTTVAFAVPAGAVVLWDAWRARESRTRAWRDVGVAMAVGIGVLLIIPLWSARTVGDWREPPYALYSKVYFPFDATGFGIDSTPPRRELPPDMQRFTQIFRPQHAWHTVANLPAIAYDRAKAIRDDMWAGWRTPFALMAIGGLVFVNAELAVALATIAVMLAVYLVFAHPSYWAVYYIEMDLVLAYLTALGVWWVLRILSDRRPWEVVRHARRVAADVPSQAALGGALAAAVAVAAVWTETTAARDRAAERAEPQRAFAAAVAALPGPSIVFVRYSTSHDIHRSLIGNPPDYASAHAWVVYDRGDDDARLIAAAPQRTPYLYDEATRRFSPLPRAVAAR